MARRTVPEDQLKRMTIDAVNGVEREFKDPFLQEMWERIQTEVREIQERGNVVDIPPEMAGE